MQHHKQSQAKKTRKAAAFAKAATDLDEAVAATVESVAPAVDEEAAARAAEEKRVAEELAVKEAEEKARVAEELAVKEAAEKAAKEDVSPASDDEDRHDVLVWWRHAFIRNGI